MASSSSAADAPSKLRFTGGRFGSSGTLSAARLVTEAVQSVPVKQVGYSGLMVPVLEDNLLAKRWEEGTYNIDSLLAYSAVCAGGLDTVPLPGDITEEQVRLKNHCDYFRSILAEKKETSKGKKLSFILQEFGREINTTGSKAYDSTIQKCVILMKDELEKAKEQILNVL